MKEFILHLGRRMWWAFWIWVYNCKVRFFNLRKEWRECLKEVKEIEIPCLNCEGKGEIFNFCHDPFYHGFHTCPKCKGTGKIQ